MDGTRAPDRGVALALALAVARRDPRTGRAAREQAVVERDRAPEPRAHGRLGGAHGAKPPPCAVLAREDLDESRVERIGAVGSVRARRADGEKRRVARVERDRGSELGSALGSPGREDRLARPRGLEILARAAARAPDLDAPGEIRLAADRRRRVARTDRDQAAAVAEIGDRDRAAEAVATLERGRRRGQRARMHEPAARFGRQHAPHLDESRHGGVVATRRRTDGEPAPVARDAFAVAPVLGARRNEAEVGADRWWRCCHRMRNGARWTRRAGHAGAAR